MLEKRRKINSDQIAFWLLCAILFDCTAFGGGSLISFFGVDFRIVLYCLFFIASLPSVIKNLGKISKNTYFIILIVWGLWIAFSTIRGLLLDNSKSFILAGLIGFASFGILPGIIAVLNDKSRILTLMKFSAYAAVVLSVQSIIVLIIYNLNVDVFSALNLFMVRGELGGSTGVNDSIVRVFLRSHPLLICGCACSIYFAIHAISKKEIITHYVIIVTSLFSLLISYTRSIYLGLIACVFVLLVGIWIMSDIGTIKKLLENIGKKVAVFMAFLLISDVVFGAAFMSYGIERSIGINIIDILAPSDHSSVPKDDETDVSQETETETAETESQEPGINVPGDDDFNINVWSDNLRDQTVHELVNMIKKHPIIGNGMGAYPPVRENNGYATEYFYLEQVMKTGIIGILLYMAPIVLMAAYLFKRRKNNSMDDNIICVVWFAGLICIAVFSWFNPYLNGSNGIVYYCCTIGVFSVLNKKEKSKEESQ